MEVKPGYKKTEVGVIPEDWEVVTAGEVGKFRGGNGFPLKLQGRTSGTYPFFKVSDMNSEGNETFMTTANHRISEKTRKQLGATAFPADSIVFAKVGAAIFLERKKILGQPSCIDNNMTAFLLDARRADVRFVHTLLLTTKLGSLVATTALPSLSGKQLSEIVLRLPPLPEQRAIAGALGDVDALLGALEKLIAKKRDLKQAAMQQLLTGQTRLPGFSGEWVVKRLGDVAHINMGQSPDSRYYNRVGQGIPLIQGNADIENRRSIPRVCTTQVTKSCDKDDLLLTVRAPVGAVGRVSLPSCIGRGVCSLKPNGIDQQFLFHALVFAEPSWKILEQGSTFTAANSGQVAAFSLSIPPSNQEQTAIAEVLSDMDAEIAALEERLAKTRALKQGMMQELLTGRVRLV